MKSKLIIFGTIVLLLVGWFYWFQYRPSQIKKGCVQYLKDKISSGSVTNKTNAQFTYDFCLHNKGL